MVKAYYRETDPNTGKAKWVVIKGLRVQSRGTRIELGYDIVQGGGNTKFFWDLEFQNTSEAFGMGYFVYNLSRKETGIAVRDIIKDWGVKMRQERKCKSCGCRLINHLRNDHYCSFCRDIYA